MTTLHQEPLGEQLKRGVDELQGVRGEMMDLFDDVRGLAKKEMELARTEMKEQVSFARNSAIFGAIAAVLALLTLAFAATTVMFALDEGMPLWLAALLTTAGLAVLTALLGVLAYTQIKRVTVAPKKTMESVNEDMQWARRRMNFNGKSATTGSSSTKRQIA
ncbi:MAG TPA: phage holin family protein [Dehalococcoidia bacterium]|nr:phage holin family protein [Dehalococcoidia bacterium]